MSTFEERKRSLSDHLKCAEEMNVSTYKVKIIEPIRITNDLKNKKLKQEFKHFKGRESIFKQPAASIRQCLPPRTIPDHVKNPKRWKYYNLSDVTPEQMSDATNRATALASIKKMEEIAKADTTTMEHDSEEDFKKPTFHFSSAIKKEHETSEEKPVFKDGKVVMPEYVVGMAKKKKDDKSTHKKDSKSIQQANNSNVLRLDHLYDEEE